MKVFVLIFAAALASASIIPHRKTKEEKQQASPLDQYVNQAESRVTTENADTTPGSTWASYSVMTDLTHDLRASRVDDVVTVLVAESASAVTTGGTQTARKSSATASASLPGVKSASAVALLANLPKLSSDSSLNGSGSTSRKTTLTTNLTARVIHVLPNGFLVIEGSKNVQINSEWQTVTVRGVVRPADLTSDNTVPSQRIAQMEVKLDGKGVINDSIRRPNFLYRLLLGVLPF